MAASEESWGDELEGLLGLDEATSSPPAEPGGQGGGHGACTAAGEACREPPQASAAPAPGGRAAGPAPKRRRVCVAPRKGAARPSFAAARAESPEQPAEPGGSPAQLPDGGSACGLAQLTEALLLRICCFLSPDEINVLGCTSRLLRTVCQDAQLWRRLYFSRWPKGPKNEEEGDEGATTEVDWKVVYMERDHQELSASLAGCAPALQPLYAQMATAKRSEALGAAHTEQLFRPPRTPHCSGRRGGAGGGEARGLSHQELQQQVAEAVDAFRRQRGLTDPALHSAHCCGEGECRGFTHLEPHDVWVCGTTGWAHRCGANCQEREVDPGSNNLVCPISGRCFDRMMSDDEFEAAAQERGGEEARGEEEWQADEGISGRLGRAFYAGYSAANERELFMQYGIRWS